jgi:hypothetical protein
MLISSLLLIAIAPLAGTPVSGAGYQGLVVSCAFVNLPQCWEPSAEAIVALERNLVGSARLQSPRGLMGLLRPLPEYRRQYWGFVLNGDRIILVTGYHQKQRVVVSGEWQHALITVAGGGGNFFSGRFSTTHARFTWLSVNAPE